MAFKKGHKINKGRKPWNKGMRGLLLNDFLIKNPTPKGSKNPNWRGGIATIKNCLDCGIKLKSYPAKYCLPCSMKHRTMPPNNKENHYRWAGGKPKCLICGKEITYKAKVCSDCYCKKEEKNPNWLGGKSFEPYSLDWKETLKKAIRQRDNYVCGICKKPQSNDVHHIDYDKKNCNPDNLITLCHRCHSKTNYKRKFWINYFKAHE